MARPWARFLILDDVLKDAEAIESHLKDMFQKVRLEVQTRIVGSSSEARQALEDHPDFFLCDIKLSGTDPRLGATNVRLGGDVAGLDLIQNLKPKFPHVNFVAVTWEFDKLGRGLKRIVVQPDFILTKAKVQILKSDDFDRYLLGYFIINRRQNQRLEVRCETEVEKICKHFFGWQRFQKPLFDCLVRQVFKGFDVQLDASQFSSGSSADNKKVRVEDFLGEVIDFVKVGTMARQGESGSAVFKAETSYKGRAYKVGLILKFCPIKDFLAEVTNYSRYVKWMLPYSWRVDILGEGISENVGLIAYSLALAGSSEASPLSAYSSAANPVPVRAFIGQVFSPTNRTWYDVVETATGRNLARDLLSRYFEADPNRVIMHLDSLKPKLQDSKVFFEIYGGQPFNAIDEFIWRVNQLTVSSTALSDYQTCICHGDLHCDNVMVGERKTHTPGVEGADHSKNSSWQFAFIDFQDTGPAHIGTDFVVFENSIRKDSSFDVGISLLDYYRAEQQSLLDMLFEKPAGEVEREGKSPLFELVREIRKAFLANFDEKHKKANKEHFVFHLFVFTLFMINDKFPALKRKELLLAFFCAVVDALWRFRKGTANGEDSEPSERAAA